MNKYFPLLFLVALITCKQVTPPIGYKLFGNIKHMPDGPVTLKRFINGSWQPVDTEMLQAETFTMEGKVELPELYHIHFADSLPEIPVFIDNHEITITADKDSLNEARISGSKVEEDYEAFWGNWQKFDVRLDSIDKLYKMARKKENLKRLTRLEQMSEATLTDKTRALKDYVRSNNASVVSAYLTWTNLAGTISLNELSSITSSFDPAIGKSVYIALLTEYINTLRKVEIGKPAPDFAMDGIDGSRIKLSSFRHAYLLLDFWASWCNPCRQQNRALADIYKNYHPKGFDILSISLDKDKKSWAGAIAKDNMIWANVSDLKGWGNRAGKLYGVRSIPANILIDRNGTIIARNLKSGELQKKLRTLLN